MNTKKAREFWLNDIDVCYTVFKSKKDASKPALRMGTKETIHVREVLPDEITLKDRLAMADDALTRIYSHGISECKCARSKTAGEYLKSLEVSN